MLCDNLEGWGGKGDGRRFGRERTCAYLWLIRVDGWQKTTQYCKAISLRFFFLIRKKKKKLR